MYQLQLIGKHSIIRNSGEVCFIAAWLMGIFHFVLGDAMPDKTHMLNKTMALALLKNHYLIHPVNMVHVKNDDKNQQEYRFQAHIKIANQSLVDKKPPEAEKKTTESAKRLLETTTDPVTNPDFSHNSQLENEIRLDEEKEKGKGFIQHVNKKEINIDPYFDIEPTKSTKTKSSKYPLNHYNHDYKNEYALPSDLLRKINEEDDAQLRIPVNKLEKKNSVKYNRRFEEMRNSTGRRANFLKQVVDSTNKLIHSVLDVTKIFRKDTEPDYPLGSNDSYVFTNLTNVIEERKDPGAAVSVFTGIRSLFTTIIGGINYILQR